MSFFTNLKIMKSALLSLKETKNYLKWLSMHSEIHKKVLEKQGFPLY